MRKLIYSLFCCWALIGVVTNADDWPRFRGPFGSGVATDSESLPTTWATNQNIAWKTPLPGPGVSSPIITGNKVLVTCYSGYGLSRKEPGEIENLKRHILCFDLNTGKQLWQQKVKASLPEDPYDKSGVSSHGYASHTPVTDGKNVYCFFGKSGVHAFDLDGNKLWNAETGKGSDPPKWGSSSSPVIHQSTLIVTASAESRTIFGFDASTGRQLWKYTSKGLDGMWGTPAMVRVSRDRSDLVLLVPKEIWGLDPLQGDVRWRQKATDSMQAYSSIISKDNRVFAFSGKGGGGLALDINERKNATNGNPTWNNNVYSTYATPVLYKQKVYVVSRGILTVVDAEYGNRLEQLRLKGAKQTGNKRFGSLDYASPIIVGDRLFWLNANGQTFVFRIGKSVEQLAINDLSSENEVFWGSPAVAQGKMVIRSSRFLYCVGK